MTLLALHKDSEFHTRDLVRVHLKIQEDNKTRTQVFEGTVIAIRGMGQNKMFTVRRIGAVGVGVERIFPLYSPLVEKVEVRALGSVRRSKIYYIRDKTVREVADLTKRRGTQQTASSKPAKTKKKARARKKIEPVSKLTRSALQKSE